MTYAYLFFSPKCNWFLRMQAKKVKLFIKRVTFVFVLLTNVSLETEITMCTVCVPCFRFIQTPEDTGTIQKLLYRKMLVLFFSPIMKIFGQRTPPAAAQPRRDEDALSILLRTKCCYRFAPVFVARESS